MTGTESISKRRFAALEEKLKKTDQDYLVHDQEGKEKSTETWTVLSRPGRDCLPGQVVMPQKGR